VHHAPAQHRIGLRRLPGHPYGLILAAVAALALGAAPAAAQPACGDVLTQDTTLTADLHCDGTALVIGAPGITLDLGGHVVGAIDPVIVNDGHDDVTIRNGKIGSTLGSILLRGVRGNVIRDIDTQGLIFGVQLTNSDHNRIVSNRVRSISLHLKGSDDNVIARNTITQYEGYIGLEDSNYNRVVDNVVWVGRSGALTMYAGSHHNRVRRNILLGDTFAVINLQNAHDNELVENTIGSGPPAGAAGEIEGSNRNLLARNTIFGVDQGFRLGSGDGNVFRRNELSGVPMSGRPPQSGPDGFAVTAGGTGTVLWDNQVSGFDDDGIDVDAPGTRLRGNSANDNGDLGIEAVHGVVDLGGNTASRNGNPLQCTNVFCG
jgi:parallel beta-helix repeat protein